MSGKDNIIEIEKLDSVSGGAGLAAADARKERLLEMIPEDVKKKLALAKGDVEVSRILAESGIDPESVEKKIKDLYSDAAGDILALTDTELENVSGGFSDDSVGEVWCDVCNNTNRDQFSYQFWASQFITGGRIFRCKKCNTYVVARKDAMSYYSEADYKNTSVFEM